MNKSETLTPKERESQKTADERSEDVAYTINHSLACLTSDFVTNPIVGGLTQKWLGKRYQIGGCGHDHSGDHDHDHHDHEHHDHEYHHHSHGIFGHTVIGEIAGDFAAVPLTIAFQRYAPGFMNLIRNITEPVLGWMFKNGANRSAKAWAKDNQVDIQSDAFKEKAAQIYEHEVQHLPQAVMWTASSMVINILTQKLSGNKNPVWQIAAGTASGVAVTAGLVVGARAVAPETAHKWDRFTSQKLFLPATKAVGKVFGVKEEAVNRMIEKEKSLEGSSWSNRMNDSTSKEQSAANARS
jgi:hypothetical protein